MYLRACCVWLVAVQLTGCYTGNNYQAYPHDWPRRMVSEAGKCPEIAGRYSNFPAGVAGVRGERLLFNLFANEMVSEFDDCRACTLEVAWLDSQQAEMSVELVIDPGNQVVGRQGERIVLNRADKDFACEDGAFTLPISRVFTIVLETIVEIGHCDLVPAEDGSLIAYQDYTLTGHVLIFPAGGRDRTFTRFERKPATSSPD